MSRLCGACQTKWWQGGVFEEKKPWLPMGEWRLGCFFFTKALLAAIVYDGQSIFLIFLKCGIHLKYSF
jgi:hypothetical protein